MKIPPSIPKMGKFYFIELTGEEVAELNRHVNGKGGFETYLRGLQARLNPATRTIKMTEEDVEDLAHHAFDYKQGGWESRLLAIFGRPLGPTLGREVETTNA